MYSFFWKYVKQQKSNDALHILKKKEKGGKGEKCRGIHFKIIEKGRFKSKANGGRV